MANRQIHNRAVNFDREAAARFQRRRLRDPRNRQIQREMVVAIKAISANAQHQAD